MLYLLTLLLVSGVLPMHVSHVIEDGDLGTPELINKYKYRVETHKVVTDDGYVLSHHRIPRGKKRSKFKIKPPVILQHGMLGSSADWILKTPTGAIGYMLADHGYDVWMINTRGNRYSEEHITLDAVNNRRDFWNFSWHEMGIYDLPNTIDYILNITNQTQVLHIGHSQGTTVLYVMLSERPEYNKKVGAHISYSPIAFHKHTTSLLFRALAPFEKAGGLAALKLFIGEFNFAPNSIYMRILTALTCNEGGVTQSICSNIFYSLMGNNPAQMNMTMLPLIFAHFPAGSSMMQMAHYIQELNSGRFRQFDHGHAGNLKKYNQSEPPDYKINNIVVPIYTFYGGKDSFAQMPDVNRLYKLLPNLKDHTLIENWAHMDFLYGIDATKLIYEKTLQILEKYR